MRETRLNAASASRPWQARLPFFYGWIIVGIGFIASGFSIGLTWAAGLLVVPMGTELHWSQTAFFFAVSLRSWLGVLITPLVGPYFDRPNGPPILALAGGLINTVSLLLIPWAVDDWRFTFLFGVLGGLAQAAQGGITPATVPKWFVRQRGSAVAISTLGGSFTAVILPPLISFLNDTAGWRSAWLVMGVAAFVIGTLPAALLRREPEDVGLLPDGGTKRVPPHRSIVTHRADEPAFTREEALRTSAFWGLLIAIALGSLANNGIPATLAPILVDRGYAFEVGAAALAWYGVGSIVGKIVWGWVVDRFPVRGAILILTAFGAIATPSVIVFPHIGPLVYGLLCGLYIGAYFFLSQMVWADYFGRAHVGAISALGRPLGLMIGASGPFVLAFTRDLTGSYDLGLWLNALSAALCFICVLLIRPPRRPAPSGITLQPADPPPSWARSAAEKPD